MMAMYSTLGDFKTVIPTPTNRSTGRSQRPSPRPQQGRTDPSFRASAELLDACESFTKYSDNLLRLPLTRRMSA